MEIKTCEEYVVNELLDTKNELAEVKEAFTELNSEYREVKADFKALKDLIKKICHYKHAEYSSDLFDFDYIFEEYNKDAFTELVRLIPELVEEQ